MKSNQSNYRISTKNLCKIEDRNSNSGRSGELNKGRLSKLYPKHPDSATHNSQSAGSNARLSNSTYFVKLVEGGVSDKKAVIISRQMADTVKNSEQYKDITIAKQRLYSDENRFIRWEHPTKAEPATVMTSKEVKSLRQKGKGKDYQYQYYLGMSQIAGESDWNEANIGSDKNGNLVAIDIGGPSTVSDRNYIGNYLFWRDLFSNAAGSNNIFAKKFKEVIVLSGGIKNDYFGFITEGPALMSYKSFSDFIKDTTDNAIKYMNHKDVCTSLCSKARITMNFLIQDGPREFISNTLTQHCNEALKNTKEGTDLYRKITAYIDGATEFITKHQVQI